MTMTTGMTADPTSQYSRIGQWLLRAAIAILAALEIYWFSDNFQLAIETFADPDPLSINLVSAITDLIVAPGLALAAIGLCIAGRRLGLAAILMLLAPLVYLWHVFAFAIAVMIYGF
jgi:hypothetical protein